MKKDQQLHALEQRHKELLHRVRLPDTLLHKDTPPVLQKLDLQVARRLVAQAPAQWLEAVPSARA